MIENGLHREIVSGLIPKWLGSPVEIKEGTLDEIRAGIPIFERRAFGLPQQHKDLSRLNSRLDMIVRLPFGEDETFLPVGVVSKEYLLIQHTEVLNTAITALQEAKINPKDVKAELKMTEYGERMALSLYLPDAYQFDPGDGHAMSLRLECINSVDGSARFRAFMGWFRFVCTNGLIIGVTRYDIRRRHLGDLPLDDISKVLSLGIKEAETDKTNFKEWLNTPIDTSQLGPWCNGSLRDTWGFKAATRAFYIAKSGKDVKIVGPYKGSRPTDIHVTQKEAVPGAPNHSNNLYDLSQILAWLSKERRDLQEQLGWREQIPELMASLFKSAVGGKVRP